MTRSRFPDAARDRLREADRRADDDAELAERVVALHYGWDHAPDEADWYDCKDEENGTKAEVKSCRTEIDGRDKRSYVGVPGRFRLWEGQLRSLLSSDATATAWVVFVLLDQNGDPVDVRRMRPSTVWSVVVDDYGGWDDSGHQDMGRQQKVPISVVFDR